MARASVPYFINSVQPRTARKSQRALRVVTSMRYVSTSTRTSASKALKDGAPYDNLIENTKPPQRLFERLPTSSLVRSVVLGQVLKSPMLFKTGLYLLEKIANSKSAFLNADKNPLIRGVVYPLIYKQFCAGRNRAEVQKTIAAIKEMGFSGVILCHSKEVMARKDSTGNQVVADAHDEETTRHEVQQWSAGNLATLDIVGEGDYIGVKFTGAGPSISGDLKDGKEPCGPVREALYEVCDRAKAENKRLWIDAEQQIYHPTIDNWTIDLMRKYNRDGEVVVLTTIQSYLKSSRQTVGEYLRLAKAEGWALGIKLVRGAYLASDVRSKIHDTKAETDASYDGIAHDILNKSWPGYDRASFPNVKIFLAGHNTKSVRKGAALAQRLAQEGALADPLQYGQLQGMADDIGCELSALGDNEKGEYEQSAIQRDYNRMAIGKPQAFKCLTWGSVHDCLHYLVRRAVENQGAVERLNTGLAEMKKELRWRLFRF